MIPDLCANNWGRDYTFQKCIRDLPRGSGDKSYQLMKDTLRNSTNGKFLVQKITLSGSDANAHAMLSCTYMNDGVVLVAAGSYVGGNGAPIQELTTSVLFPADCLAEIADPTNGDCTKKAKENAFAAPYYIPCIDEDENAIVEYENECLESLLLRVLSAKMSGRPVKGLLLELLLAGSGAMLSQRYLTKVGTMAKVHDFSIVVDEILTAGRCSHKHLLLTMDAPESFVNAVSHVTLGKWFQVGIVLSTKEHLDKYNTTNTLVARQENSIPISLMEPQKRLESVLLLLQDIPAKRSAAMKFLTGAKKEKIIFWGNGLILFGPLVREGIAAGMRSRFLPMVEPGLKVQVKSHYEEQLRKEVVNLSVKSSVTKWITYLDNQSQLDSTTHHYLFAKFLVEFANNKKVVKVSQFGRCFEYPHLETHAKKIKMKPHLLCASLGRMKALGLLTEHRFPDVNVSQKNGSRKRGCRHYVCDKSLIKFWEKIDFK